MILATIVLTLSLGLTAFAGEWKQDEIGWQYQKDDGRYPASVFQKIYSNWLYFGENGYMKTGWYPFENGWFGFSENRYNINPLAPFTGTLVGAPYEEWKSFSGSSEATINGISNGSVTYYNGQYWSDPSAYQNRIVYEHDVAPEPVKDRFRIY